MEKAKYQFNFKENGAAHLDSKNSNHKTGLGEKRDTNRRADVQKAEPSALTVKKLVGSKKKKGQSVAYAADCPEGTHYLWKIF